MTQPPDRDSPYDRPAPVFVGFEEGQSAWIGALYEFTTASGDYVYLHEMDCVDMQYRPQSRQLTLTFECVSSDLMPTSVAVLTFDDTEIYDWGTTFATLDPSTDVRVRGQVSALTCMDDSPDGSNLRGVSFHLNLFEVAIAFFATTVTCKVRPGRWEPT